MNRFIRSASLALAVLFAFACSGPLNLSSTTDNASLSRAITANFSGDVTIKALANGKFVTAENAGAQALIANRDAAQGWETFTVVPMGNGNVALKAKANNKFVCADNFGNSALIANRESASGWESFQLVPMGGDNFALKALANGKYVCADNAGASALIANRDSAQGWETFTIVPVGINPTPSPTPPIVGTPVERFGALKLVGRQLSDQNGNAVQLRGMSTHGLQWFGDFVNESCLTYLRDNWKIDIIRLAMYTKEGGYLDNPSVKATVYKGVDLAIKLGLYVMIDWHILDDNNPQFNQGAAKAFFQEMSNAYKSTPNVLYEICNEPNPRPDGSSPVSWNANIRPYALDIIPAIRANAPNSIVIVGTGTWSQDVHDAAANPLPFANVMYTLHFYAGSHGQWLIDRAASALNSIAIFATEWGTSGADGAGSINYGESDRWMNFLNSRKISWCNWSLCDKNEATAALNGGASRSGGWSDSQISPSGLYVRNQLRNR